MHIFRLRNIFLACFIIMLSVLLVHPIRGDDNSSQSSLYSASSATQWSTAKSNEAQLVVFRLYREILNREPDDTGLNHFVTELLRGEKNEEWLRKVLSDSEEKRALDEQRKNKKTFIIRLFLRGGLFLAAILILVFCLKRFCPSFFKKLPKILLLILITLALAEVVFRIYQRINPLYFFYDNSYNRFRGAPCAKDWDFKLNTKGFKDKEFSQIKTNEFRILGLGDSFAFGVVPYSFNYYTLLEDRLKDAGLDAEVINMGISFTAPPDYLNLLIREGLQLSPDMVIVSFFCGNDFYETYHGGRNPRWYDYSFVMAFIHYLIAIRPDYQGQAIHGENVYDDDAPTLSAEGYLALQKQRSYICRPDREALADEWPSTRQALDEIRRTCEQRDISLLLMIIPDENQVNTNLQALITADLIRNGDLPVWNWSQPNQLVAEYLEAAGINYLDLYPAFCELSTHTQLYKPRDSHWNIAGNALAAELLAEKVLTVRRMPLP